jgi:hypothetical protein
MWALADRDGAGRLLAAAAYLGAVVAFLLAQELGLRLRREEPRSAGRGGRGAAGTS